MSNENKMLGAVIDEAEIRRRGSAVWPYVHFKPGTPVDPAVVDKLMDGLVDIHVHGAPAGGWLAGRPTVVHTTMEASEQKVGALVFKDHNTMTNNFSQMINESFEIIRKQKEAAGETFTPTKLYGGIVLNYPVGGLNPDAVSTCLGYGDCVKACPFDAIHIVDGIAKVDRAKCVGCGACAAVCPNSVISVIPEHKRKPVVLCQNKDKGGDTRKACTAGCIGCMKCAKACPKEAITVENNLAHIDQSKCVGCQLCVKECPVGVIHVPANE